MARPLFEQIQHLKPEHSFQTILSSNGTLQFFSMAELCSFRERENYRISEPSSGRELARDFFQAMAREECLVLVPPSTESERSALLRNLPDFKKLPQGIRLITFTTGTTGTAKAVLHTENSLYASAQQTQRVFQNQKAIYCALPSWGMAGVHFQFLLPLLNCGSAITSQEAFLFTGAHLPSLLEREACSLVVLNPWLLKTMLQIIEPQILKGLFLSLTAPLPERERKACLEKFSLRLEEIYGMSESAGPLALEGKSLGAETKLTAEGELLIRGPQLFWGYSFEGNLEPAPEWFPTGDIVKGQDELVVVSRKKELIDFGGRKIAPALVEEILRKYNGITDCVAFAIPDQDAGEAMGVLIVSSSTFQEHEWIRFLSQALSKTLYPRLWKKVIALPRSPNGKVLRKEAAKILLDSELDSEN